MQQVLADELKARLLVAAVGGPEASRQRPVSRGKLLPRERVDALVDEFTPFLELSPLAADGMYGGDAPGAGLVTGVGRVAGRECVIVANAATVKGGTYYPMTVKKHLRGQEVALHNHQIPGVQVRVSRKREGDMNTDTLPQAVTVYEVGARDGLQNEPATVPTEVKAEFIRRLIAAGAGAIELTSFVSPKWIPQLADAAELMALLGPLDVRAPVLVPNERGLDRALACGATEVAVFGSATESFAQRNLNRSVAESLEMFRPVVTRALDAKVAVRGYLSMCFGDPWEGPVSPQQVVRPALELLEQGVGELSLGDTIGVATPNSVIDLLDALTSAGVPLGVLAVHFHDTYGQALANTLTAITHGITTVDASAGGLGGCPYAESATGNLATEDLLWQLNGLGIVTGIDLEAVTRASLWMAGRLGRPSPSRTVTALAAKLGKVGS